MVPSHDKAARGGVAVVIRVQSEYVDSKHPECRRKLFGEHDLRCVMSPCHRRVVARGFSRNVFAWPMRARHGSVFSLRAHVLAFSLRVRFKCPLVWRYNPRSTTASVVLTCSVPHAPRNIETVTHSMIKRRLNVHGLGNHARLVRDTRFCAISDLSANDSATQPCPRVELSLLRPRRGQSAGQIGQQESNGPRAALAYHGCSTRRNHLRSHHLEIARHGNLLPASPFSNQGKVW